MPWSKARLTRQLKPMRCMPMSKAIAGRVPTPSAKLIEGIASGSLRIPIERTLSWKTSLPRLI